jgi:tRNA modification GTPase
LHGSPAVTKAVLQRLSKIKGFRPSEPGEFTQRAFYNNKLDLTQVEGLSNLLHAETEAQRKLAMQQLSGAFKSLYSSWTNAIVKQLANVEAFLDFSEDEQLDSTHILKDVNLSTLKIKCEIQKHLKNNVGGEVLRSGVQISLFGRPNSGKSSLLNLLAKRDIAIVTKVPGTTRDVISTTIDVGGYAVILNDTAGLRETDDIIEKEGIKRTLQQ